MRKLMRRNSRVLFVAGTWFAFCCFAMPAAAAPGDNLTGLKTSRHCGGEGVWVQILGAGGNELNDEQSTASYLVWLDDHARLMVNTSAGSSVQFDKSGANFAHLDAIVYTNLLAQHVVDLPAFVSASQDIGRDRPLAVLGPAGDGTYPDAKQVVERLVGPNGAFPQLADILTFRSAAGYKISARNVPATGQRRWARYGSQHFRLSAIPVHHQDVPSLAWRVEMGGTVLVFTGDFNNDKDVVANFAKGADIIVMPHAVLESTRGALRDAYVIPTQIGQIASRAEAGMIILSGRTNRTRGRESDTREAIEANYDGSLVFANDLECWGFD